MVKKSTQRKVRKWYVNKYGKKALRNDRNHAATKTTSVTKYKRGKNAKHMDFPGVDTKRPKGKRKSRSLPPRDAKGRFKKKRS